MKKQSFLVALALFLTFGLVACGGTDNGDSGEQDQVAEQPEPAPEPEPEPEPEEEPDDEVVDGPGHASSRGNIQTEAELRDALSADSEERAWVAGLGADIHVTGEPLVIDGEVERHSGGQWTGVLARKLGFYIRDEINGIPRVPVGARTLTVDEGIIVNSPNTFFISEGPFIAEVHGNVYVNSPYFRLSGVRIHGDIIFATEHYRDTATAQVWDSELAHIEEGEDPDYETDFVLYQGNSGFGTISHADATTNVSNIEFSEMVTGEIRIAE